MTILVVEDDDGMCRWYAALMAHWQFDFIIARDAEQALNVLHGERRIDLVVVDLLLPGMSGAEFITEMRRRDGAAALPAVLVVTAHPDFAGCFGKVNMINCPVLPKPVTGGQLLRAINEAAGITAGLPALAPAGTG